MSIGASQCNVYSLFSNSYLVNESQKRHFDANIQFIYSNRDVYIVIPLCSKLLHSAIHNIIDA
jgi:hypothetical protein